MTIASSVRLTATNADGSNPPINIVVNSPSDISDGGASLNNGATSPTAFQYVDTRRDRGDQHQHQRARGRL